jgi:hypothetical protein
MPIVLVTWEAEIVRILVGGQPGPKVHPFSTSSWVWWWVFGIIATQEAEIERIVVLGQLGPKKKKKKFAKFISKDKN